MNSNINTIVNEPLEYMYIITSERFSLQYKFIINQTNWNILHEILHRLSIIVSRIQEQICTFYYIYLFIIYSQLRLIEPPVKNMVPRWLY